MGSYGISTYWEIAREIGYRTGSRSVDLDGELLGVSDLALWDFHCLGDHDMDSSGDLCYIY